MFSRKEKNVTLFYAKNENREDVYGFEEFFDVVKNFNFDDSYITLWPLS